MNITGSGTGRNQVFDDLESSCSPDQHEVSRKILAPLDHEIKELLVIGPIMEKLLGTLVSEYSGFQNPKPENQMFRLWQRASGPIL